MSSTPTYPDSFEAACQEWFNVLGSQSVLRSPEVLHHYGRTTLPDAPAPVAVLRPANTEQVAAVIQIALSHSVPLYPISRGKNWGWGDACPPTGGQAIVDLSGMDRILEFNNELGYVVVQPGVTQGQLAEMLAGSDWWLDWTAAGPDTSLMGNILERGITREERFNQVCGMEVVLADSSIVRTGFGHFPGSRVSYVARWGIGPALDGLFSQSNLGVVTELGFWLQPKPQHAEIGYYTIPDTALAAALDVLRPLRLRGICSALPLFLTPGDGSGPLWFGILELSGNPLAVAAHCDELQTALAPYAKVIFPPPALAEHAPDRARTLAALGLPPLPMFDDIVHRMTPLGGPEMSPEGLLMFLGGPAVQHPSVPPQSIDPLDHDYGFLWHWSTCPMLGREVRQMVDLVRSLLLAHGFPPLLTLRYINGRAVVMVIRVVFDRKLPERRLAAQLCYRAILKATVAAGYPPARMTIDGMDHLDPAGSTFWQLVRHLKDALDPHQILAPGRYLTP